MAEATTTTEPIDLSNIEKLVTADKIAELTRSRNCLVHAMSSLDIVRVVWELVSHLPMMQMHRMFSTEEIFQTSSLHLQMLGADPFESLRDGKQKMVLCPVYLPMKRAFPSKYPGYEHGVKQMKPLTTSWITYRSNLVERIILVDRDGCFHLLEGYWEEPRMCLIRPHYKYEGHRQLQGVALKKVENADELHRSIGVGDAVLFFTLATDLLQEVVDATLWSVRRDYEMSVGLEGVGDALLQDKYLAIVRAANLLGRVCGKVKHRYGV